MWQRETQYETMQILERDFTPSYTCIIYISKNEIRGDQC